MATTENAPRDNNGIPTALFEIVGGNRQVMPGQIDQSVGRVLVDDVGSGGSLTPTSGQYKIFVTVGTTDADYLVANYTDIGAAINAAYAGLPTAGGIIFIKNGSYDYSTPIVLSTAEKFVLLTGAPAGAVTLNYTGGSTSIALTYNISKAITAGHGVSNLKFTGPGSLGSTAGFLLGGLGADDEKGFAGGMLQNVDVSGFGCNIVIGNNAFLVTLDNVVSNFGRILLFEKGGAGAGATDWTVNGANTINSGENMRCINCTFADANNQLFGESTARFAVHLQVSGLTDWNFVTTSFDDAELYIDYTGGTGNQVHLIGCHFENPAADSIGKYSFITTLSGSTSTSLDLLDTTFVQDANTSVPDQLINAGCQVSMVGCSATRNGGAATAARFVNFQDATTGNNLRFLGNTNLNTCVTYLAGTFAMTGGEGTVNGLGAYSFITGAGVLISKNANTRLDASTFTGTGNNDIGDKINAAYLYGWSTLGLQSVDIFVPAAVYSYSTPIVFGHLGSRVHLWGITGAGTELQFTGGAGTIACTVNTGEQNAGSNHTSYVAIENITFTGDRRSTTTPEIGVYCGGTNGAAHAVLKNVVIQTFGQGLIIGQHTYHWLWDSGTIKNCGQLISILAANDSGEALHFHNGFFVDPFDATYAPSNAIQFADSATSSCLFSGCSFDDMSMRIGQANNVTTVGCHWENPGSANWGAYTYVVIDNNIATNFCSSGDTWFATGSTSPTNYISTGGNVTLTGAIVRKFTGSTMTNFAVLTGSGRITWSGFNNVGVVAFTNVVSGVAYTPNGFANQAGSYYTLDTTASTRAVGISLGYVAKTSGYTLTGSDYIVDCTSGTFTATLPTAVGITGRMYVIKNSGAGIITINTTSAQTIDGNASGAITLATQYASITVMSNGANWIITG